MFDRRGDDVGACRLPATAPELRMIVGLRSAAAEDKLFRVAADQGAHLPPGSFERLLSRLTEMMDTGSVTEASVNACRNTSSTSLATGVVAL